MKIICLEGGRILNLAHVVRVEPGCDVGGLPTWEVQLVTDGNRPARMLVGRNDYEHIRATVQGRVWVPPEMDGRSA